ncbi:hypothetical protein L596_004333 [Steinernema carpocapsae]|uniref:Uncharacterized protein n=1 Tax=Steinernema carpocapsae TaxID=34508 RepID=A0A4V6I8B5_STECR|nr:hypothetical protein L596_004333 [Steinernema carpocapsae]
MVDLIEDVDSVDPCLKTDHFHISEVESDDSRDQIFRKKRRTTKKRSKDGSRTQNTRQLKHVSKLEQDLGSDADMFPEMDEPEEDPIKSYKDMVDLIEDVDSVGPCLKTDHFHISEVESDDSRDQIFGKNAERQRSDPIKSYKDMVDLIEDVDSVGPCVFRTGKKRKKNTRGKFDPKYKTPKTQKLCAKLEKTFMRRMFWKMNSATTDRNLHPTKCTTQLVEPAVTAWGFSWNRLKIAGSSSVVSVIDDAENQKIPRRAELCAPVKIMKGTVFTRPLLVAPQYLKEAAAPASTSRHGTV